MRTLFVMLIGCLFAATLNGDDDILVLKAGEISAYHPDLAKLLIESSTKTREAYVTGAIGADSPLPPSAERRHYLNVVHRSGYSWAESHEAIADFYIIIEGSGTLLLGGEMVDALAIDVPGEWRSPTLKDAEPHVIAKGDLINIPSNVPHQWDLTDDESITYIIVKVLEDAAPGAQQ